MKIRFFSLLITLAFLAFSGLAVAHPCKHHEVKTHEHCSPATDPVTSLYTVTSTGGTTGTHEHGLVWGWDWLDGAAKSVDYVDFKNVGWGAVNLSYFQALNGPFSTNGVNCFPSVDVQLHAGGFGKSKHSSANGKFWFQGFTNDGSGIPVLYLLQLYGVFDDVKKWPPATNTHTLITMTAWKMSVENEGQEIKNISCLGEGDTETDPVFPTTIIFPETIIKVARTQ